MRACQNCGKASPDEARFCQSCGRPLEVIGPSREERKLVTVLFCDLVGFTTKSDRADPEDVLSMLRPYHARLRDEIQRYGGTLEKFMGDGVLAVFGAPVAHEDDATRGVECALAILEAVPDINAAHPRLNLAVRIGVATGEVMVTLRSQPDQRESMVAGDTVNIAARLQHEAAPGTIVAEEVTYRATKHLIEYGELGAVRLRGKADPTHVWKAVGVRSRLGVDVDQQPRGPFIGRELELALLREAHQRVAGEGGPQLVTIVGEPGVGKTRLLFEFRQWVEARPGSVWRQGRCLPYGDGVGFWALGEVAKVHAGILESDGPEEATQKLAVAVTAAIDEPSEQEWIRSRLQPLVGLWAGEVAGAAGRDESFTAWRRFLEGVAASGPLILLFEDIHWADRAMLDFVDYLVDWGASVPILVLCTARPELYQRAPLWGGGKKNAATATLAPLSKEETAQLIAGLLPEAVLPADIEAVLLDRSGGNPLYAEEFVRMLLDRRILERPADVFRVSPGSSIPVPETVQALIAARLDLLADESKLLLQDASVVGKVFWSGALASMAGIQESAALKLLHGLSRYELIRPARRSSIKDQAEFAFWHILVRDVAYGQIPRALRARKHRAAAEWIERIAGDRLGDHAEILAFHYTEAIELIRASGDEESVGELREQAMHFLTLAGDRLIELDVARAGDYYRRALELVPDQRGRPPSLLRKVANAATLAAQFDDADAAYRAAIFAYQARGDPIGAAEAKVELADFLWERGDSTASAALVEEVIAALDIAPAGTALALACLLKSRSLWDVGGQEAERLAWIERALSVVRQLDAKEMLVRALGYRGAARQAVGDTDGAVADGREALQLALSVGLGREAARLYHNLGLWLLWDKDPAAGLKLLGEGIEFAERRGIVSSAMFLKTLLAWGLADGGRWDDALSLTDQLVASSRDPRARTSALVTRARVLLARGEMAEASSLITEVLAEVRKQGPLGDILEALTVSALVEWHRGRTEVALALIEEIERTGAQLDTIELLDILPILLSAGEADRVGRYLEATTPARAVGQRHALVNVRAMVAEAEGRLGQAADLYEEAAEGWKGFGLLPRRAEALVGAGRCLVHLGRVKEATDRLNRARELLQPLGARLLVTEIDQLVEQVTAPRS